MSNYKGKAINPKTGKLEAAEFLDDYYGRHKYGVRFRDGKVYQERKLELLKEENEQNNK